MTYDLDCRYDSRKSFYGKARVGASDGVLELRSYGTLVATIIGSKAYVYGSWSNTTWRHVKEFLLQNGFKAESARQILKDYGTDKNPRYLI